MDVSAKLNGNLNSSVINSTTLIIAGNEEIYDIGALSHILDVTISFLTIVFNGIIIKFLLSHRSKFSEVIFQQTLCLSVTDLVAGFSPATSCLSLIDGLNRSFKACAALFLIGTGAQLAVLINLTFLSIRRWMVLRNVSRPRANIQTISTKSKVFYLLCPWIITAVGTTPLIRTLIIHEPTKANGCLSILTFGKNGNVLFYSALNVISLVILTLFYIYSIIAVKRTRIPNVNAIRSRNQRLQEKAFKHLIAVLVAANLTALPVVINVILSATNTVRNGQLFYLSRQVKMTTTFINPLVYSFHITELRNVIKDSLVPKCIRVGSSQNDTGEMYAEQTDAPGNDRY